MVNCEGISAKGAWEALGNDERDQESEDDRILPAVMVREDENEKIEAPAKKKPGRKRTKLSKLDQLLKNLPLGVSFLGPAGHCKKEYILEQLKDGLKAVG